MLPENRREFLKASALAAVAGAVECDALAAGETQPPDQPLSPEQFQARALECLGGAWPTPCELNPQTIKVEQRNGYRIEWVHYNTEPDDRVPALLLVPDRASAQHPAAGVAVWHQHAGQWHLGKSEPGGLAGDPMHHTGAALARLGYVVLCPDALCFEERQDPTGKLKGGNFERFEFLRYVVAGRSMAWKNILDMRRAIDFLVSRPEVDAQRLGCYGHSMGSTFTWLVGPFEPRLKCLVGNCCLPTYAAIHRHRLLHCFPNFIPGLYRYGDTADLAALIAPRALHLNLGETDGGSPIKEARAGVARIAAAYAAAGKPENFSCYIEPDTGHVLSEKMWQQVRQTFERHLG